MKAESGVCTMAQAEALKKLGVKKEREFFVWFEVATLDKNGDPVDWFPALFRPNTGETDYICLTDVPRECYDKDDPEMELETRGGLPAFTVAELIAFIPARWSVQRMNSTDYALFNHNNIPYMPTAAPTPGEAFGKAALLLLEMRFMTVEQANEILNG